jgi:hypothetical protein
VSTANWLALVLSCFAAAGTWLAGKGKWQGWAIGLASQPVWVVFALVAHTPALLLSTLVYGSVYGRNAWLWYVSARAAKYLGVPPVASAPRAERYTKGGYQGSSPANKVGPPSKSRRW